MSGTPAGTVRGLPHALPAGETQLWQGSPAFRPMAMGAFHLRVWIVYVAVMLAWGVYSAAQSHHSLRVAEAAGFWSLLLGLIALGLVMGFAWLTARGTIYTITSKRVVIGYGAAIRKHVNLPFCVIQSAGLRLAADGSGDIVMTPEAGSKLSYLLLWPHARVGKGGRVEPMLRAVPNAASVARLLTEALDPTAQAVAFAPARDAARQDAGIGALATGRAA